MGSPRSLWIRCMMLIVLVVMGYMGTVFYRPQIQPQQSEVVPSVASSCAQPASEVESGPQQSPEDQKISDYYSFVLKSLLKGEDSIMPMPARCPSPSPPVARSAQPHACPPRNVYIDLGANRANTYELYTRSRIYNTSITQPWDIYLWEVVPPFVKLCEIWVEGVMQSGDEKKARESIDFSGVVPGLTECVRDEHAGKHNIDKCLPGLKQFDNHWQWTPEKLNNTVEHALRVADRVGDCAYTKEHRAPNGNFYAVVPAGHGPCPTMITMPFSVVNYCNGGSNVVKKHVVGPDIGTKHYKAPLINFVAWLQTHFTQEDHIVVKIDIEGAEYPLCRELLSSGAVHLIDELTVEWHSTNGVFEKQVTQADRDVEKLFQSVLKYLDVPETYHG